MIRVVTTVFGFVLCLAASIGFWDYHAQSGLAGKTLTNYSLSEWTQSVAARGQKAAQSKFAADPNSTASGSQGPKWTVYAETGEDAPAPLNTFLPQNIKGMQAVTWSVAHDYLFTGDPGALTSDQAYSLGAPGTRSPAMHYPRLLRLNPAPSQPKLQPGRVAYENGGWNVALTVQVKEAALSDVQAADAADPVLKAPVHSVYQGVAFQDVTEGAGLAPGSRKFEGWIGQGLYITALTNADDQMLARVLSGIDYGGLNAILAQPVDGVGQDNSALHNRLIQQRTADAALLAQLNAQRQNWSNEHLHALMAQAVADGRSIAQICVDHHGQTLCQRIES